MSADRVKKRIHAAVGLEAERDICFVRQPVEADLEYTGVREIAQKRQVDCDGYN